MVLFPRNPKHEFNSRCLSGRKLPPGRISDLKWSWVQFKGQLVSWTENGRYFIKVESTQWTLCENERSWNEKLDLAVKYLPSFSEISLYITVPNNSHIFWKI